INEHDGEIALVSQVDWRVDKPTAGDVFTIGVLAQVLQPKRNQVSAAGVVRVEIKALRRLRMLDLGCDETGYFAQIELLEAGKMPLAQSRSFAQQVLGKLNEINRLERGRYPTAELLLLEGLAELTDAIATLFDGGVLLRQELLEELDLGLRTEAILLALEVELAGQRQSKARRAGARRDARGGSSAPHQEGDDDELDELRAKVAEADLPDGARDRVERELSRLGKMHAMSAEANVLRSWVEQVLQVPFGSFSPDQIVLADAAALLDAEHHGLSDPKERILEYLAVRSQSAQASGPVLCLAGAPGTGKTSLARAVAKAMGREFVRVSLGGVADEAQIRGHRRTYVGAMPGRIVGALQRAGTMNPVILLDEIDKLSSHLRGDPAAALLEVLDPEQNHAFADHYMEMGVDLSQILFLCTANREDALPAPLLDRLEVLRLGGYSEEEKLLIARKHLVPRQAIQAGFSVNQVQFTRQALERIVRLYTKEAGLRGLERALAACSRKLTRDCLRRRPQRAVSDYGRLRVGASQVTRFLGPPLAERQPWAQIPAVGVGFGLAWSQVGGDVLRIEAVMFPGKGSLVCTGSLGDVMRESANLALSYLRAHAVELGLPENPLKDFDLHLHVPDGAQPKEGPSAGLAVALSMYSVLAQRPLPTTFACTGELTLTGSVLAVGGLREKFLAAQRQGLERVFYPRANHAFVNSLARSIHRGLQLVPVDHFADLVEVLGFNIARGPSATLNADA
ncbi:MAG: endopeptidase La, partial [Myxococcota bacterium]|nr:endopeptidase La [Myxococcota bacterium]